MYPDGTIIKYLFWMAIGAMQVLIWQSIGIWARQYNETLKRWQQHLFYGCFASFCIVVFAGFTLKGEYEGNAGWYMIGFFGSMHIIALGVLIRLFIMKKSESAKDVAEN